MFAYIYKTTNLINNKIYIGQKRAKNFVPRYFGTGTYIKNALRKYGKDNFKVELIAEAHDEKSINILEKYYIEAYRRTGIEMYNIAEGGYGNPYKHPIPGHNKGVHWSPEIRKRMSEAHQGCWDRKPHPCLGTHHSEETKRKIGLKSVGRIIPFNHTRLGVPLSKKHKEHIREGLIKHYEKEKQ